MKLELTTNLDQADALIARATALVLAKDAATKKKLALLGIDPVDLSNRLEALKEARHRILENEFQVLRAVSVLDHEVSRGLGSPHLPANNPLASLLALLGVEADAPPAPSAAGPSSSTSALSYTTSSSSVPGGSSLSWHFPPGSSPSAQGPAAPGAEPHPPA